MFIELTSRSNGRKIKVSKHAIGYMKDVGILEWKQEGLFKRGNWVEDKKDRFTKLNIFGQIVYVNETVEEIVKLIEGDWMDIDGKITRNETKKYDDFYFEAINPELGG